MRSLTVKLTLAFLLTGLITVGLAGIFVRYLTGVEFSRFVSERELLEFKGTVADYYKQHGSWADVDAYLRAHAAPPRDGPAPPRGPDGQPAPPPPQGPPPFLLIDQSGYAVTMTPAYRVGDPVPAEVVGGGSPVEVGGQRIGTVATVGRVQELNARDRDFLSRTNRALIFTIIGGAGVALAIGLVLTRLLLRPIEALTSAIRAMRQGQPVQALPVTSRDEIGELVQAFNQMSADLAQSNQVRRQMTADIAHELRTPLSVLTGYIETLRDETLPPSRERFEAMFQEATLLQRLIDDLRLLSLADAGELSLHRQAVAPDRLLVAVAASFEQQAVQRGIALELRIDDDMQPMLIDRERMQQVLGNLVGNALRYTSPAGAITLAATQVGIGVKIEVTDTGQGVAPEALPHLFERLYRAEPSRHVHDGGSGLGLAIAKTIVEAHGGQIAARSEPGAGLRVTIMLP